MSNFDQSDGDHNPVVNLLACGFGQWASSRTIGPLLSHPRPLLRLVGIYGACEVQLPPQAPPGLSAILQSTPTFGTLSEALDNLAGSPNAPTAVAISSPNGLHIPQAREAIAAGLHVYIEKPISTHRQDLMDLLREAERRDRLVYTGVQRRLEAPFQYIYQCVRARQNFGQLASIRCTLFDGRSPGGWRTDPELAHGGVLIDAGYHLVDQAAWLLSAQNLSIDEIRHTSLYLTRFVGQGTGVEMGAFGFALIDDVELIVDFSYNSPNNTVFERLDIRDTEHAQITLTRNQFERSAQPGVIRHLLPDGNPAIAYLGTGAARTGVKALDLMLDGAAMTSGPLEQFLQAVAGTTREDTCSGRQSVLTWKLVRHLYSHATVA